MRLELEEYVGDRPLAVKWYITRQIMFSFEIDTKDAEKVLPEDVVPIELRPGISLLHVSALSYAGGNFGSDSPPFSEVVAVISVPPDLSWEMPIPRFSFFPINIYSDSQDFVDGEAEGIQTPTSLVKSLNVSFHPDGMGVSISDDRGKIAEFTNTAGEEDRPYRDYDIWGQHYNVTRGPLFGGPWHWQGHGFEHQKKGQWGKLYDHPIFKGINVSRVRTCFRQMISTVGRDCFERFYQVKPQ